MQNSFNQFFTKKNIITLTLAIAVFLIFKIISEILAPILTPKDILQEFGLESVIYKILMVSFTFATILAIPKYSLSDFGFRPPAHKVKYFKIIWVTIVLVIGGMFVFNILYMNLLPKIFNNPDYAASGFKTNYTIVSTIISIVLWSSFAEEVYIRGLFQSLIMDLRNFKILKLSVPVWLSGLLFGLIHLSVYSPGKHYYTLYIVSQATVLGIYAAYCRERYNSIYVSIFVHFLANLISLILLILSKMNGA